MLNKEKNILFIGSGKSAALVSEVDLNKYTVVCLNNAWRLFENKKFEYWVRPNDFPRENYPKNTQFDREIKYEEYSVAMAEICKNLNINTKSPQHFLGYTSFFAGLYWIANVLKPDKISLLGFDHDYNQTKVQKWEQDNRPNIQNNFNNKKEKTATEWANNYFKGMDKDFFYGHGTPDPLRLGVEQLTSKFNLAIRYFKRMNIKLVNLSPVISSINMIEKEDIRDHQKCYLKNLNHLGGHYNTTHTDVGTIGYIKRSLKISSMIDIGCGPMGMKPIADSFGIKYLGIDGDISIKKDKNFVLHDYSVGPYVPAEKCDLAWSVEFLEHVEEKYIPNFMESFKRCRHACITHALPGKKGHHHVNCQLPDYWKNVFVEYGFEYSEFHTEQIRKFSSMKREFIKNTGMFFVNKNF